MLKRLTRQERETRERTTHLTPERITQYLMRAARATTPRDFATVTLALLREYGADAYAILTSDASSAELRLKPMTANPAWTRTFGDLRKHTHPERLELLVKPSLHARLQDGRLTELLTASRDVRLLDAAGLSKLLAPDRTEERPTGGVIWVPIFQDGTTTHLLAHLSGNRALVEQALIPLVRAVLRHAEAAGSITRQWLLLTTSAIVTASNGLRSRQPDLDLSDNTPIERTFPHARAHLERLQAALFLQPSPYPITLDLDAVTRGHRGEQHLTLALEATPVRMNADEYIFLTRPTSAAGESLEELGEDAILNTTMHQLGAFLVLDRFGTITVATENLTDQLGHDTMSIRGAHISAILEQDSIPTFNALRERTLGLLHAPGPNTRVPNPHRVPITLTARNGRKQQHKLALTLLRSRVEGELVPRGFVAVLQSTDDHVLLHRELAERIKYVRHDRYSSPQLISSIIEQIRCAPKLTRAELDRYLTDIHDEAYVWSELAHAHTQIIDTVTAPHRASDEPTDPLIDLNYAVREKAPKYVRYYARHRLLSPDRARVKTVIREELDGVQAWGGDAGTLALEYALRNMVENAVKYGTPDERGDRVITIIVGLDPEHTDRARVAVTNRASNLDPATLSKAWGHRVRLSNSASQTRGTGIGLWLTATLTEHAGGSVGAYMHDDREHVTFYVSFPLISFTAPSGQRVQVRPLQDGHPQPVDPEQVRAVVKRHTRPKAITPKILVLDPHEVDLRRTTHQFQRAMAQVTPVTTPQAAAEALAANQYDLLLTEYDARHLEQLKELLCGARRRGVLTRVLTSTPSAVPADLLNISGAPTALYKNDLTPALAATLTHAPGRQGAAGPATTN